MAGLWQAAYRCDLQAAPEGPEEQTKSGNERNAVTKAKEITSMSCCFFFFFRQVNKLCHTCSEGYGESVVTRAESVERGKGQ